MDSNTARSLIRLNRLFYDRFAVEFSRTRRSVTPGVRRALEHLEGSRRILDLGCGDGRVGRHLSRLPSRGRPGRYLGIDSSPGLLAIHERTDGFACRGYRLAVEDMALPSWPQRLGLGPGGFDGALCLAALFHIPGSRRRLRVLRQIHSLLAPGSPAVVSVWQFLHLERFRRKILPWSALGLSPEQVDRGDLLIDWQGTERGVRYVHHFAAEELAGLCRAAGFRLVASYREDGATRDLTLYMILRS